GTLDEVAVRDEDGTASRRFVRDRVSTGTDVRPYSSADRGDDIYQERAAHVLAPPGEWELIAPAITRRAVGTRYAEAPMVVPANPGDPRGGVYLWADQQWEHSPAGEPWEQQLSPYWAPSLDSGDWTPVPWTTPIYHLARGVIRHGCVFGITVLEHAALRGARLLRLRVERPPTRVRYRRGEGLDLSGLRVCADFDDGSVGEELLPGHGGFSVDCFELERPGPQKVRIRATDGGNTRCAVFTVYVEAPCAWPAGSEDRASRRVGDPGGAEEVGAQLVAPFLGGALLLPQQLIHPLVQRRRDAPGKLLPARAQREHLLVAVGPRVVDVLDHRLPAVQAVCVRHVVEEQQQLVGAGARVLVARGPRLGEQPREAGA